MVEIKNLRQSTNKGQSLAELLLAIGVSGIILASVAALIYVGLLSSRTARENAFAQTLIQDMSSALRGLAAIDWRLMWGSNGLVSYWGMNEGSDYRLYDPVSGNNGTAQNSPIWESGANCKFGKCLLFNGTNQYVSVEDSSNLRITGDLTISFWMYKSSEATDWQRLVGKGNSTLRNYGVWEESGAGKRILFQQYDSSGIAIINLFSNSTIEVGQWYHIAVTISGNTGSIYINGNLDSTASRTGTPATSADPLTIAYAGFLTYFPGRIDEIKIYNRALSSSEIAAMYATPAGLYPKSLGGFWSINEGAESISNPLFGTFMRWYTIEMVQRDASDNIVSSGGTPDPSTVKVTYFVKTPKGRIISSSEYITRSESRVMLQTDWSGGPGASGIYISATNLFATSTNINYSSTTGQIRLKMIGEP